MRLQVAGAALLLVSIGAFTSGCGNTGVYGSAVTPAGPSSAAPSSSTSAGSWQPASIEKLKLVPAKHGSPTVRVRSTKATQELGVVVAFAGRAAKGATYRFEVRVRGSRDLVGRRLAIYLGANGVYVGKPQLKKVKPDWQRYVVSGRASAGHHPYIRGHVYVPQWALPQRANGDTKPDSWIEVAGRIEQPISAASP